MAKYKSGWLRKIGENKMVYRLIDELVCYGLNSQLVDAADEVYVKNRLLELFELDA